MSEVLEEIWHLDAVVFRSFFVRARCGWRNPNFLSELLVALKFLFAFQSPSHFDSPVEIFLKRSLCADDRNLIDFISVSIREQSQKLRP